MNNQCSNCIYRDRMYINRCTKGRLEFNMIGVACPEYTVAIISSSDSSTSEPFDPFYDKDSKYKVWRG